MSAMLARGIGDQPGQQGQQLGQHQQNAFISPSMQGPTCAAQQFAAQLPGKLPTMSPQELATVFGQLRSKIEELHQQASRFQMAAQAGENHI